MSAEGRALLMNGECLHAVAGIPVRNQRVLLNCRHSQRHGSRARAVVVVLTVVSQGG